MGGEHQQEGLGKREWQSQRRCSHLTVTRGRGKRRGRGDRRGERRREEGERRREIGGGRGKREREEGESVSTAYS